MMLYKKKPFEGVRPIHIFVKYPIEIIKRLEKNDLVLTDDPEVCFYCDKSGHYKIKLDESGLKCELQPAPRRFIVNKESTISSNKLYLQKCGSKKAIPIITQDPGFDTYEFNTTLELNKGDQIFTKFGMFTCLNPGLHNVTFWPNRMMVTTITT